MNLPEKGGSLLFFGYFFIYLSIFLLNFHYLTAFFLFIVDLSKKMVYNTTVN